MTRRTALIALVTAGGLAVGLPLAGHWTRRARGPSCALDGVPIDAAFQVTVVDAGDRPWTFCCVRCAQIWLAHQAAAPLRITVTDEAGTGPVDAPSAWYVRSAVVSTPTSGNRVHVFRAQADAQKHAAAHTGVVLGDAQKPFR